MQMPVMHVDGGRHGSPHDPQLLGSDIVSTHVPAHIMFGGTHVDVQAPAAHVSPPGQA
jgi:hypothetical protein